MYYKNKKISITNKTTKEMEIALCRHFNNEFSNLIIPNVSYGIELHECDLLVLTKSGYANEIEIKISLADLKKDIEKKHGHNSDKIRCLYFAIPSSLAKHFCLIPERAGIIVVNSQGECFLIQKPKVNKSRKFSDNEKYKFARLALIRFWKMKEEILSLKIN